MDFSMQWHGTTPRAYGASWGLAALLRMPLGILLLALAHASFAAVVIMEERFDYFAEPTSVPLSLSQAQERFSRGEMERIRRHDLTFGLGASPTWLHFTVMNDNNTRAEMVLRAGTTWIDSIDVYLVDNNGSVQHWQAGDRYPGARGVVPGYGTLVPISIAPGRSELYIRAQTADPMVLPIDLQLASDIPTLAMKINLGYGLLYGMLVTLVAYNLLFYAVLRRIRYLYYSFYVAAFVVMNIGYTGQGLGWLWSDSPQFQNYSTLVMMVIYGSAGLSFALSFLGTAEHMPRLTRAIHGYQWLGVGGIALFTLYGLQLAAVWLAFTFLTSMALLMLVVGIMSVHRAEEGRYFLVAALAGMVGVLSTGLSVWSLIPYTTMTYHGAELGVLIEASIFAVALSKQLRIREEARRKAEYLAAYDPLTGLRNRRAFMEEANVLWRDAERWHRPLTLIMADVDHFKTINDEYGHAVGDLALQKMARLLQENTRHGDVVARWGGEEFILLLPDTGGDIGLQLAERIRNAIEAAPLAVEDMQITMTCSFGLASLTHHQQLESLIETADQALLVAKHAGRNRVMLEDVTSS